MKILSILLGFIFYGGLALHSASAGNDPLWMTTPCAQEDSSNCYWDAEASGDHRGHSFYSIRVGDEDCIVYWNNRYGKRHNYCI